MMVSITFLYRRSGKSQRHQFGAALLAKKISYGRVKTPQESTTPVVCTYRLDSRRGA